MANEMVLSSAKKQD